MTALQFLTMSVITQVMIGAYGVRHSFRIKNKPKPTNMIDFEELFIGGVLLLSFLGIFFFTLYLNIQPYLS